MPHKKVSHTTWVCFTIYAVAQKKLIFKEASDKSYSYLKACEPRHIRGRSHMARIKTSPQLKRKLC